MKLLNCSNRLNGERSWGRRPTTFNRGQLGLKSLFTIKNLTPRFSPSMAREPLGVPLERAAARTAAGRARLGVGCQKRIRCYAGSKVIMKITRQWIALIGLGLG